MPKPNNRSYSRKASEAITLLAQMIRAARITGRMTTEDLAERAGISRGLLYRIEKGDPACSIGVFFEVAAIVAVPLFELQASPIGGRISDVRAHLALLPKAVRKTSKAVNDDF